MWGERALKSVMLSMTTVVKVTGYSCARRAKCIGKSILKLTNQKISGTKSVSNLILAVEVHCHKVQGMTEAFFDSIIPGKFICCLAQEKR